MVISLRKLNTDLNRNYRNDLNQNFTDIEQEVNKHASDIVRVETESKERDNLLAGTDVQAIIDRINTSADNADVQAQHAKTQGDYAKNQGDYALEQGNYAQSKGAYADEKAILADEAAAVASQEASNLSQLKIDVTTATQDANNAASSANTQAAYAQEQGNYAKAQGDAAKAVIENGVVTSVNAKSGVVTLEATDVGAIPSTEKGVANGVAGLNADGKVIDASGNEVTGATVPDASTTQKGIVQLNDTITSSSIIQAATPNSVKQVNDKVKVLFQSILPTEKLSATSGVITEILNDTVWIDEINRILGTNLSSSCLKATIKHYKRSIYEVQSIEIYIASLDSTYEFIPVATAHRSYHYNMEWKPWYVTYNVFTGFGSPEGARYGVQGNLCVDNTNNKIYRKTSYTGVIPSNTGWVQIGG